MGAPGGAAPAAGGMSSIQAALEAQQKMLAAKAGGAPGAPVDPSVTLAMAKARAAALMTCADQPQGPAVVPGLDFAGRPVPALPPLPQALLPHNQALNLMQPPSGKAAPVPPGLIPPGGAPAACPVPGGMQALMSMPKAPQAMLGAGSASALAGCGGCVGRPQWGSAVGAGSRPAFGAQGKMGCGAPPKMSNIPPGVTALGTAAVQGSLTSKAAANAGPPPTGKAVVAAPGISVQAGVAPTALGGAVAKGAVLAPTSAPAPPVPKPSPVGTANLANLGTMKEVSPALAALMQGGLF